MGTIADKLNKLLNTKSLIKSAIISKGQSVSDSEPFSAYPNKILAIQTGVDTSDATATASDIASGKTAYGSSGKITGTIPVRISNATYTNTDQRGISFPSGNNVTVIGATNSDVLLRAGALVTIDMPKSNFGNATAADVLAGKRFTSQDGIYIAGTLTIPEASPIFVTYSIGNGDGITQSNNGFTIVIPGKWNKVAFRRTLDTSEGSLQCCGATLYRNGGGMMLVQMEGRTYSFTLSYSSSTDKTTLTIDKTVVNQGEIQLLSATGGELFAVYDTGVNS